MTENNPAIQDAQNSRDALMTSYFFSPYSFFYDTTSEREKFNKNLKIIKKNIALISTLGIFLLIGFIGIPELTRNLPFYPDAPTANFPIPNNETEARLQDLEYLKIM